ncbi:E3 ubiquitin ligase BIG BROTHER-like [Iris pallida]|uniref:E3 ubiquitin ligase BIG BROTHER-like n=1 Tax=Iris pallida TaxID=29817 RepID=A0AAX6F7Z2_IRIPA|nr:E3 ubiquitin ligase BIG BROTHER-like [Iris pallida]
MRYEISAKIHSLPHFSRSPAFPLNFLPSLIFLPPDQTIGYFFTLSRLEESSLLTSIDTSSFFFFFSSLSTKGFFILFDFGLNRGILNFSLVRGILHHRWPSGLLFEGHK